MNSPAKSEPDPGRFVLRLFIAGSSARSQRTIGNLRALCAEHFRDRMDLEIVDIYQHPQMAEADQIVAAPTLLKLLPLPVRRIIGDLSDAPRVLRALGLSAGSPGAGR